MVLEQAEQVGGIARTEIYKGYRFDIGGHRFFTQLPQIEALWRELLGSELLDRPRRSRIYFDGRFFDYPLRLADTLKNLGIWKSAAAVFSYLAARMRPLKPEDTFEQWVINRFGHYLYRRFFKTYTEKVWGLPCSEIHAEWAAQRIQGLSLPVAIRQALPLPSRRPPKTLIARFLYPRLGPGMMWEAAAAAIETAGGQVHCQTRVYRIFHRAGRATAVEMMVDSENRHISIEGQLLSSMPLPALINALDPPPPANVLAAAQALSYRDFLTVLIIVNAVDLFPDNWIYIHEPGLQVGRIQNFKNWSPAMVPDPNKSALGLEYFCQQDDALWQLSDVELLALAGRELVQLGFVTAEAILDGTVARQPKAYPVYSQAYAKNLAVIQEYLSGFTNLQTIGRNGLHKYNNQDHSMLTALMAVENMSGAGHDLWRVNTERSYHEAIKIPAEFD